MTGFGLIPLALARLGTCAGSVRPVLAVLALMLPAPPVLAERVEVKVSGLEGEQEANVLALLGIYQDRGEDLTEDSLAALHRQAPDDIRDALAPFGLYRVEVKEA